MNLSYVTPARMVVRLCFVILLVLGLLLWFANLQLELVHIGIGIIFVLGMWTIALAAFATPQAPRSLAVVVLLWGVVLAGFGLTQASILPGGSHVVVQVLHIVFGIAAIGMTEALAGKLTRAPA